MEVIVEEVSWGEVCQLCLKRLPMIDRSRNTHPYCEEKKESK